MTAPIDAARFIGQTHRVTEEESGRTVIIEIGDGGSLQATDTGRQLWDGRQVLRLRCSFDDGRRSDVRTADAAAGKLAEKLFRPYSVGAYGRNSDGAARVDREVRKDGPKNGRTTFSFFVWCGPLDLSGKYDAMDEAGLSFEEIRAAIWEDHATLARGERVPATWRRPARRETHKEAMFELMRQAHR